MSKRPELMYEVVWFDECFTKKEHSGRVVKLCSHPPTVKDAIRDIMHEGIMI